MKKNNTESDLPQRIEAGVQLGVARAIDRHKRLGQSIVIYQDGEIITVAPQDIKVPPFPDLSRFE